MKQIGCAFCGRDVGEVAWSCGGCGVVACSAECLAKYADAMVQRGRRDCGECRQAVAKGRSA